MNALSKTELKAICDEVKKIEHVTNCTADYRGDDQIWIVVESFLANDDGSRVERGRGIVILTTAQFLKGMDSSIPLDESIPPRHRRQAPGI